MRKYLSIILSIVLYANSTAFAYISGKSEPTKTLVYCPDSVTCTKAHNLKSCQYSGDGNTCWGYIGGGQGLPDVAGEYKLVNVVSGYHWPDGLPICIYENTNTGTNYTIAVYANYQSNLELAYDKTTKWEIAPQGYPYPSSCKASSPDCPLTEQSALEIIDNNIKGGLLAEINGNKVIDRKIQSNADLPVDSNPAFGKVVYENALAYCGSTKECAIDIATTNGDILGSVVVDMDNKMRILNIINHSASGAVLRQVMPFNTVEVIKSDIPSPSLDIKNNIYSEIIASINGNTVSDNPVSFAGHIDITYNKALTICTRSNECKIDIKTTKGAGLGAAVIDVKNNMKILQTTSLHPSEIIIEQDDTDGIEIKYAYK